MCYNISVLENESALSEGRCKMKTKTNPQNKDAIQINRNLTAIMLCLIGILTNLFLGDLASWGKWPLYLDTVGTVSIAVLGGYLPGVTVGFFTNLLKSINDSSALYYGVMNVLIALAASFMAKRGYFRKPRLIARAILVFTLIGGGLGTLIPLVLEGFSFDSEALSTILMKTGFFSENSAHLTSSLIWDLADKTLTVMLVLPFIYLLPERVRKRFSFNGWMQTPLSSEATEAAKHTQSRVISLRTKILLVVSASLIAVASVATGISVRLYRNALIKDHTTVAEGAARIAAGVIDTEMIDIYMKQGEAAEGYAETKRLLTQIRDCTADIEYLYVYKIMPDGCHVIFDLDTEDMPGSPPGTVVPFEEPFQHAIPDLLAGRPIEPIITKGVYGWLLTDYEPVYDANGDCCCYAAADVSMKQIGMIERRFLVEILSLFLGFFILIFVLVRWLVEYHIILPVNSIAISADAFAYDSETARESSIERIRELQIHTGDEVENLYHAITKTSDDSMRYVADVQEKTDQISRMQKALIMVLADIVESRDKNTGAHVRKTAAYTEIILHEMRKMGYYSDMLSDSFISDVVNSAPLHDIGKIQVPDSILNKAGRLDDDEFSVMKTHTTAGKDIIKQAIALVPNSGYLNEARNLAAYHHEKWDGSGYPTGLSGEKIPLSARVMAVADVFDALVSKRSYKEPMSFEDAMKIIKDGSGKHFDPLIVDAFVSAEQEVRRVEKNFSLQTNEAGCFR